jgi:primosomal protein N''
MGWTSNKYPKLEALRAENDKLRRLYDEVLESEHNLNVQVEKLQATNDELIAENKSNHNVGVEYRDSAQRLSAQVEDLQRQVTTRNMDIVALKNRVKRLECAITQAVNAIDSE